MIYYNERRPTNKSTELYIAIGSAMVILGTAALGYLMGYDDHARQANRSYY